MKAITDTGIRGYLKWLQQDQPHVYALAAPIIAQRFPQAFSDHEQSLALGALSDTTGGAVSGDTTYYGDSPDAFSTGASSGIQPDVASAANTGAASPSIAQDIVNVVTGIANVASNYQMTQAQQQAYKQINQTQAANLAAGNQPLMISSSASGIPFIAGITKQAAAIGGSGLFLVGGAAVLLYFLSKGRRAA